MLGIHRDTGGAKTAFEFLRIEESSGKITYLGQPAGPTADAVPAGGERDGERAVFANPQHDFPQRILYWREGASLCAAVEGPMERRDGERALVLEAGCAEVVAAERFQVAGNAASSRARFSPITER